MLPVHSENICTTQCGDGNDQYAAYTAKSYGNKFLTKLLGIYHLRKRTAVRKLYKQCEIFRNVYEKQSVYSGTQDIPPYVQP